MAVQFEIDATSFGCFAKEDFLIVIASHPFCGIESGLLGGATNRL